jgi:hypothetical protein
MTMVALFMRSYAERNAPAVLGTDPALLRALLDFPQGERRARRPPAGPQHLFDAEQQAWVRSAAQVHQGCDDV